MSGGFVTAGELIAEALQALMAPPFSGVGLWLLAGVFVWSGAAKLRRPALAALALVDFGVARRARPGLGRALGGGELALALLLVALPWPTTALAAGLLWCFALLIARSLHAGERFACFCFGEADDRLSAWTLGRTVGLALLATLVALGASRSPVHPDAARMVLGAISGGALLGAAALGGYAPGLLRWSRDYPRG